MDSATLIADARRAAGLTDFDSESFREGLDIVAANLANSTDLTDIGRKTIAGIATRMLANRLRIADYARRHPAILSRTVARPVFILGVRVGNVAPGEIEADLPAMPVHPEDEMVSVDEPDHPLDLDRATVRGIGRRLEAIGKVTVQIVAHSVGSPA